MANGEQSNVIGTSEEYNNAGKEMVKLAAYICSGNLSQEEKDELTKQFEKTSDSIMTKQDQDCRPR